ncbi:hypothetical protein C8Q73DRAFT_796064 [Cubamyces lactineus]|nr:hypothetical protein C8Q73DRAFT_796064 [Cubamyces lactineus]
MSATSYKRGKRDTATIVTPLPLPNSQRQVYNKPSARVDPARIPEDIYREISLHLSDADSLRFATASKTVYRAVGPRPRYVVAKSSSQVIALAKFIAEHQSTLVSLDVHMTTDDSVLDAMCDILAKANRSLRRLVVNTATLQHLASQGQLQSLGFSGLTGLTLYDTSEEILRELHLPSSLRTLRLVRCISSMTWTELAGAVQGPSALVDLCLQDCDFEEPEDVSGSEVTNSDSFAFQSLTTLRVISTVLPESLLLFSKMFPRITTLVMTYSLFPFEDESLISRNSHSFQTLALSELDERLEIPWPVYNLRVLAMREKDLQCALDSVSTDDLTGLFIRARRMVQSIWTSNIVNDVTDIRWLEFESIEKDFTTTITLFTRLFEEQDPYVSECLPLMMLSIAAPRRRNDHSFSATFLINAAAALPNLRYIALADPKEVPTALMDDLSGDRAPWRWWRVIRGERTELKEIPGWEGERVRRFFREADREKVDAFDEHFHALR